MSKSSTNAGGQMIPLEQIEAVNRLRSLDEDAVQNLVASMGGEKGDKTNIIQPIVVRSKSFGGYQLVAGWHRLEAATRLGWKTISAIVVSGLTEDDARILEIDENLHRRELSPGDYAEFATMKIRLALKGDGRDKLPAISELGEKAGNAELYRQIAGMAGVDPETIRLAVRRRRQLDAVWGSLKGTSAMNSGMALDRLRKKFKANMDVVVARASEFGGDIDAAMDAVGAEIPKTSKQISAKQALKILKDAWKSCPRIQRDQFIAFLKSEGEI